EVAAPQSAAQRDRLAGDVAARGGDARNAAVHDLEAGDARLLEHANPVRDGALDESHAGVGRVHAPIERRHNAANDIVELRDRPDVYDRARRKLEGIDAEIVRERSLAADVAQPVFARRDAEAAALTPTGLLPGFRAERGVERGAVAGERGEADGRAQLPHHG